MLKLWLTYSWKDNEQQDVDFIAQELRGVGIEVKLDRWNLVAGQRLWEQFDRFITREEESDAWMIFATPNSLGSEPCREEVAYALDRALSKRGVGFPVIGLFAGPANLDLFPAALRTRLCVNIEDPDWKERIRAAYRREAPTVQSVNLAPYFVAEHRVPEGVMIEFRPRAGIWIDFTVAVPLSDVAKLRWVAIGAPGRPAQPPGGMRTSGVSPFKFNDSGPPEDVKFVRCIGSNASPAASGFALFTERPNAVVFGPADGPLHWMPARSA
jgi:hypothetical protein